LQRDSTTATVERGGGESKHKMGDKTILKQKKKNKLLKGRKEGRKKERSFLRWMHARGREMLTWA
jgi:hypothetical protein